jgi:hypothetical protein
MSDNIYNTIRERISKESSNYYKRFFVKELMKYSFSSEKAKYLIDWFFGENSELKGIELSIPESWKIAEMANAYKSTYGEDLAKKSIKICEEKDHTDSKLSNKLKLEALGADSEQRMELIKIYMSGNHSWSNEQLSDSISGYVSTHISKQIKKEYYDYYFDHLLEGMRNYPQTMAKVNFMNSKLSEF